MISLNYIYDERHFKYYEKTYFINLWWANPEILEGSCSYGIKRAGVFVRYESWGYYKKLPSEFSEYKKMIFDI